MAMSNLSSYLPQLVKAFNVSEVNAGKYAGIVSSSLSVSRIGSSIIWGYVCDKFGRKSSLIWSGSGLAVATLLFGFTTSYIWTVVTRSFQGLFMGLIVITKSLIADVADDKNLSTGLSFIFSANNMGYIIGPSMAGFLVFPAEKYPKVFVKDGFFSAFKVLLPNVIICVGLLVVLLVAYAVLSRQERVVENNDESETVQESSQLLYESGFNDDEAKSDEKLLVAQTSPLKRQSIIDLKYGTESKCASIDSKTRYGRLLKNKNFILSISLYGMFSLTSVGYEDLFPVFAATDIKYNGLSMSTSDIGVLYFATGITVVVIQFSIINKIITKFGSKKIFSVATFLFSILVFLLPTVAKIKNRMFLWVSLWLTQCLMRSTYSAGILCVNIFINNSVDSEQVGMANGLGLSVASFGRSIGSVSFGLAYSWSLSNVKKRLATESSVGFPFNEYFSFILIAFFSILLLVVTSFLPASINQKKIINENENLK